MEVQLHEKEPPIQVGASSELDDILTGAVQRAKTQGLLSCILLIHANGSSLSLVVGGDETAVTFTNSDREPPYLVSKGALRASKSVLTCFLLYEHHTEFSADKVVSYEAGLRAAHEFFDTGNLPTTIDWVEV